MRKTYLTEMAFLAVAATLTFSAPAKAGFFEDLEIFIANFGTAHEADGYRDTGCDPAFQTVIETASGEYAYSNNPTCPRVSGPSDDLSPTPVAVEEPEEEEPEEPTDPEEPPTDPVCKGDCKA